MMWKPDLFLLTRVFQPAADRLARFATCFVIARFLLIMAAVLNVELAADFLWSHSQRLVIVSSACMAVCNVCTIRDCSKTRQRMGSGAANPNIMQYALTRHFFLVVAVPVLGRTIFGHLTYPEQLFPAQGLAWLCGLYFMACTANPPPERVERFSMLPQGA